MAKEIFRRDKDQVNKIRQSIQDVKDSASEKLPTLTDVGKAGGSIKGVTSKSLYFKRWVNMQQQINPLIGKHITAAPEYSTESVIVDQKVTDLSDDMKENLNKGTESYNPEADDTKVEDLGTAPKVDHQKDKKFIDISIIENTTRRMVSHKNQEIEDSCKHQMRSYHDDPNYETEMPVNQIIEEYRSNLIAAEKDKKRLQ